MLIFYFNLGWFPEPGRLDIMLIDPPTGSPALLLIDSGRLPVTGRFSGTESNI